MYLEMYLFSEYCSGLHNFGVIGQRKLKLTMFPYVSTNMKTARHDAQRRSPSDSRCPLLADSGYWAPSASLQFRDITAVCTEVLSQVSIVQMIADHT